MNTPQPPAAPPPHNPLAGLQLDRVEERRGDSDWLRARWAGARVLVLNAEGDVRADAAGRLQPLAAAQLDGDCFGQSCFLGVAADGVSWFALPMQAHAHDATGAPVRWQGLRRAAADWPAFETGLFTYARTLALWRARSQYCGRCGAPTQTERAGHSMRCSAPACALEQFPRLDPAIIVLVTDGARCLLGRQAGWPAGRYSTLAGFVEPGESLEEAVCREVREESGVIVRDCRYQSSQPWPFPSSLMIGFRAEAGDATIRLGDELEDARWFTVDDLLEGIAGGSLRASSRISVAFRLLQGWVAEQRGEDAAAALAAGD